MYDKDLRMKGIDRKTEKSTFLLRADSGATEAQILAVTGLSMCGVTGYTETSTTTFATAQNVVTTSNVQNDRDFKCILGFQGAEGSFKIVIPAPKINIEGGIIIRWGENHAYCPTTKAASGENGNDGTAIAALVATLTGDTTVKFTSGRLYKRP